MSRRHERGVVIVTLGLAAVALLLFAALAIDYGVAANQRRKSQNTADAGVLGGGRLLLEGSSHSDIAEEVIDVTWENLRADSTFTEANDLTRDEWAALWATCTEPDPTGYPTRATQSACIRFSQFNSRIRVRVPTLHTATFFAGIAGFDSVAVDALAEAELVPDGSGGIVPFGLPSSGAARTEICLKSSSPGHAPNTGACDDALVDSDGNFGSLDVALYGNPVLGTPQQCQGDTQRTLATNMIVGVDHPLDEYREAGEESEAIRNDRALCPDLAARPNQLLGQKGIGSSLDPGFLAGTTIDGRPRAGRLTTTPFETMVVRQGQGSSPGVAIDNRPLWSFIDPAVTSPPSCVRATIEALPDVTARTAAMVQCIDDYRSSGATHEVFVADLARSPRAAFVPQLHADTWNAPDDVPQLYNIRRFRPVYIQALFFKCTATACDAMHVPGMSSGTPFPVDRNKEVEAMTALLLPDDMVPQVLLDNGPSAERPRTLVLRR